MRLKLLVIAPLTLSLLGCQAGYLLENAYYQADLLLKRKSNTQALQSSDLDDTQKSKIRLAEEARSFAEQELGLKKSDNYTQFVKLDGPYVVHSLTVAPKYELKPYEWWFPFFGKFPYLGYYNKDSAQLAQKKYQEQGYDTFVRGVSAFSSLGWFKDPILSSMLRYSDYDLVNLIIHETVHATIYIKDAVDFNERLAVFIGNIGTEKFYLKKEGKDSPTLDAATKSNEDDKLFSMFITQELDELDEWYKSHHQGEISEEDRQKRFQLIKDNFAQKVLPKMKADGYKWFTEAEINNARLLGYRTYYRDLSEFEKLYKSLGEDFQKLISYCKDLENKEDPEKFLTATVQTNSKLQ